MKGIFVGLCCLLLIISHLYATPLLGPWTDEINALNVQLSQIQATLTVQNQTINELKAKYNLYNEKLKTIIGDWIAVPSSYPYNANVGSVVQTPDNVFFLNMSHTTVIGNGPLYPVTTISQKVGSHGSSLCYVRPASIVSLATLSRMGHQLVFADSTIVNFDIATNTPTTFTPNYYLVGCSSGYGAGTKAEFLGCLNFTMATQQLVGHIDRIKMTFPVFDQVDISVFPSYHTQRSFATSVITPENKVIYYGGAVYSDLMTFTNVTGAVTIYDPMANTFTSGFPGTPRTKHIHISSIMK